MRILENLAGLAALVTIIAAFMRLWSLVVASATTMVALEVLDIALSSHWACSKWPKLRRYQLPQPPDDEAGVAVVGLGPRPTKRVGAEAAIKPEDD
ncbi:MAG TPA: hypothetical protein VJB98_04000 [Candidatus Paceibacterota bacterium]